MKKQQSNKKAFTIIEVVLVLAVAGLIFLVVFQAIPRLQRSRRDNQRKRDVEAIFAVITDYQSNTGSIPLVSGTGAFMDAFDATPSGTFHSYIEGDNIEDPNGAAYIAVGSGPPALGQIRYIRNHECNATGTSWVSNPGANNYMILMALERGMYCVDNA